MPNNQNDKVESTNKGGAPIGNNNAAKGRQVTAMLEAALNKNDRQRLREGVEVIADAFASGEVWAINTVLDRLEGKPHQSSTISGDPTAPLISVIERRIVDAVNDSSN
jgi:hypothetical protein